MNETFQTDNESSAESIDRNKRSVQKTGIDKLALRYGAVKDLDNPPHESVDCEKDDNLGYAYIAKYHGIYLSNLNVFIIMSEKIYNINVLLSMSLCRISHVI